MTIEQIRKKVKKEYEEKLNNYAKENYYFRKEREQLLAEVKTLRERVEYLEAKEKSRNSKLDGIFEIFSKVSDKYV